MVWADADWVYALQFMTSGGRISSHYGGIGGKPTIMSSEDGVLVGFSGSIKSSMMHQIQVSKSYFIHRFTDNSRFRPSGVTTCWELNLVEIRNTSDTLEALAGLPSMIGNSLVIRRLHTYPVSTSGVGSYWCYSGAFSDCYIKIIEIHDSLKITYGNSGIDGTVNHSAPWHGGHGGNRHLFQLEPGEYIVKVHGRFHNHIDQLRFVTNTGRS